MASAMAFKIAGAVGMRAGSPTPLAPKGPVGSSSSTRIGITSGISFDGWDEIVDKGERLSWDEFLHQRKSQSHHDPAGDLPYTLLGWMAFPTSWQATTRLTFTLPVSVSTSTSAR